MNGGRRYQVQRVLGEGAFGAVYLARTIGLGVQREVAIKVLHKDRADNPAIVRRLRDEARMLAMIRHRAIVRVDDLVELDGDWSIVMEYVEGVDVATIIQAGPLPPRVAVAIAEEVANALASAWEQAGPDGTPLHLIHRDIKPSNLRVTPRGEIKVLDFGVARADFDGREAGTTRSTFGTLTYMAQERFDGNDIAAGDVYSLGVTLFEMLTGVAPGKIAADSDRQPPGRRYTAQWASIQAVSPELFELVRVMLSLEPGNRPSARSVARALEDLRSRMRGARLEDWAATSLPDPPAPGSAEGERRTGTILVETGGVRKKSARINPLPIAGAVVVTTLLLGGLAVGGVGAFLYTRSPSAEVVKTPVAPPVTAGLTPAALPVPTTGPKAEATTAPKAPDRKAASRGANTSISASKAKEPAATPTSAPVATDALATGRLDLLGDPVRASVRGENGATSTSLSRLAPGRYTLTVEFDDGSPVTLSNVLVEAGKTSSWTCKASFRNCKSTGGPAAQ